MNLPSTRKKLLLYNPASGRQTRLEEIARVCRLLDGHGWAVLPVPTRGPGTAARQVMEHRDEIDTVIVLGGDGTIHEVLQALPGSGLTLGILPGGTANVLARETGMPGRLEEAAAAMVQGRPTMVSAGLAGGRYFLAMAGIGFDAAVVEGLSSRLKTRLGRGAFAWEAFRQLRRYHFRPARFLINGGIHEAPFAVVSNIRLYAGGFVMAPSGSLTEDTFDLCLFTGYGLTRYLRYWFALMRGRHLQLPEIIHRKAKELIIEGDPAIPVQLDGEPAGRLPVRIVCHPEAVRLILPSPAAAAARR